MFDKLNKTKKKKIEKSIRKKIKKIRKKYNKNLETRTCDLTVALNKLCGTNNLPF